MAGSTKKANPSLIVVMAMLGFSVGFTLALVTIDVQPVAPDGSMVGLATLNSSVFAAFGTSAMWDKTGDVLLLLSIAVAFGAAVFGLIQLVKNRRLERPLLCLAVIYVAVAVLYAVFEMVSLNVRPVLVDGVAEASFPSSHTMAVVLIMGTAPICLKRLMGKRPAFTVITVIAVVVIVLMAVSRVLSGQHWLTDVVAGVLYALTLVAAYGAAVGRPLGGNLPEGERWASSGAYGPSANGGVLDRDASKYARSGYGRARVQEEEPGNRVAAGPRPAVHPAQAFQGGRGVQNPPAARSAQGPDAARPVQRSNASAGNQAPGRAAYPAQDPRMSARPRPSVKDRGRHSR